MTKNKQLIIDCCIMANSNIDLIESLTNDMKIKFFCIKALEMIEKINESLQG